MTSLTQQFIDNQWVASASRQYLAVTNPYTEANTMTTKLKVTGMTCLHCVGAVKKALEALPGVDSAEVSLEQAQALVSGDADVTAMVAAVKEAGYSAEVE